MAKSRAVNRILHIINSTRFNEEQQVIALQQAAAVHPKYRHIFKLTGLIDSKEYDTKEYDRSNESYYEKQEELIMLAKGRAIEEIISVFFE